MKFKHVLILAIMLSGLSLYGKDSGLTGKVTDKNTSKPLTGVVVRAKADKSDITAVTDRFGVYRFKAAPGTYTLRISYFINIDSTFNDVKISDNSVTVLNFAIEPNTLPLQRESPVPLEDTKVSYKRSMGKGEKPIVMYDADVSSSKTTPISPGEYTGSSSEAPSGAEAPLAVSSADDGAVVERGGAAQTGKAGVLTSGEINDFRKWDLWKDINDTDLKTYREKWVFNPQDRYVIQLVTKDNRPGVDYEVKLLDKDGAEVWAGRSDNTGKAELWANLFEGANGNSTGFAVSVNVNGKTAYKENIKKFHDGINTIVIDDYCKVPDMVDIVFAVDATGSMGDEIGYLKAELNDIIGKLKNRQKDLTINLGSIFYRDATDSYIIQKSDISSDIDKTIAFIDQQKADGGGDFPEAVDMALQEAVNGMSWSKNAVARIVFLILDAPPHETPEVKEKLKEITAKAALLGIRIIPVTCSGIDKSTEYLMRCLALASNGTYVFLTDDSGVGDSHIKPTTDKYDVELLNDLFIRLISQFTTVPSCGDESPLAGVDTLNSIYNKDETKLDASDPTNVEILNNVRCYPNPTSGELTIEITGDIEELFIVDISGKILEKPVAAKGSNPVNLGQYPTGIYFIKFMSGGKWGSQKIMLVR